MARWRSQSAESREVSGTSFPGLAAQCLGCAVIIDNPNGTSNTSPTCIVSAASFDGRAIRTVGGRAKNGELPVLQKAFIDHLLSLTR